ncbi:MAG TPA: 1,4-beta-xylanase, partial [Blastocatellia bacterium]|nr:1,4-beta-xylanase [Blastocatellia bacterium]
MKRSNSKWLPNSLAALCVLSFCLLAGFPAAAQKQTALKDAFKNDFLIGAALNPRQFFEQDQRGVEIV